MRDSLGSHTGTDVADQIFDVLKEYKICGNQIAYFAANNAINKDKALQGLSERVDLDPVTLRLGCAGHIFNLVCSAILFGVDKDALADAQFDFESDADAGTQVVDAFEATLQHGNQTKQHRA